MIFTFFHGALLGILLSIFVGPIFFVLIRTSINDGFKNALFMILGIFLSDLGCIFLCYMGLVQAFADPAYKKWILLGGGIILTVTGFITFLSKKEINQNKMDTGGVRSVGLLIKGFLFNVTTPTVLLFWIGAVGFAVSSYQGDRNMVIIYFVGTLFTVLSIDVLKAYLASKIRNWFTPKVMHLINKITGAGILIFGIIMLVRVYLNR
ncbi:MAG TPA: LysE family transporter [Saprospiraceae bacterium]|nr:LysE family transporter [Saprospiraceae bacterium]